MSEDEEEYQEEIQEIADLSDEEAQRIIRVNQSFTDRYNAKANFESQKKWTTVFERAPKETIPFIIYVVYDASTFLTVLFVLLQYTDIRLWIGAFLLFVALIAPLSVLPHESWKKLFGYLKRKLTKSSDRENNTKKREG